MDVDKVLQHLVKYDRSLPAIKLAWNCELEMEDCRIVPRISPSHYKSELLLSSSERYSLLCRQQRKFEYHKCGFEIVAVPSIVVFQNYEVGQKYSTRLSLRNIGKMSQKATFFMDESNGFSFDEGSNRIAKFAPGMTVTITINFVPEEDTDCYHKIVVSTKTSRFAIPVMGIGRRGIIELPDVFDFGQVPVKVLKKKCFMAYNCGPKTARFTLTTDGSFSVKPERGVVAPQDSLPFEISFIADLKQDYEGYVLIKYDNDEEVHCACKAHGIDADITITPNAINFEGTYLGMKSKSTAVIFNNSDEILDFKWLKYVATAESSNFTENGGGDTSARGKWQYVIGSGGAESRRHLNITESQYQTSEIENAFFHQNIIIEPLVGKIQPHSSVEVLMIFAPTAHFKYHIDAYLSITGLQDPVNVPIFGKGLGPEFRFAFQELDIGPIFLGGSHSYELAVVNTSQIEGTIRFDKIVSSGKHISIKVEPEKLTLSPDQYGAFYLNLVCCGQLGDFVENLRFTALRANEHHILSLKGKKGFPTMHFSLPELDFGEVAYSFPKTKQILLINDSLNSVAVVLEIKENGTDGPVDFNMLLEMHKRKTPDSNEDDIMKNPKEFTMEPAAFSLSPRGFQRITVTLCGNNCRKITSAIALCVAVDGGEISEPLMSLPIRAICKTPRLVNADPDYHFKNAFLYFSNSGELSIKNPSNLRGIYYIVPDEAHAETVKSPWTKLVGICEQKSVTIVPFTFTPINAGDSSASYNLYVLGNKIKLATLTVRIHAVAAKLAVSSKKIEFGVVDVLEPSVQLFEIINDSPLTIPFSVHMEEGGGENGDLWEFVPAEDIIQPDSTIAIRLTVTLKEIGVHNALIRVQMQEAANYIDLKLTAIGRGGCLLFTPPLDNPGVLDFGQMFTKTHKTFVVEVTNMGYCPKVLEWIHSLDTPPADEMELRKFNRPGIGKNKKRNVVKYVRKDPIVFTITPQKKVLQPMQSTTISFHASSLSRHTVTDEYHLWTYTPRESKEHMRIYEKRVPRRSRVDINNGIKPYQESYKPMLTLAIEMRASFESPVLIFSRKSILFQIDAFPSQTDFLQEDMLKIENRGTLPLTATFQTKFPFSMKMKHLGIDDDTTAWTHTFEPGETFLLTIVFDGQHLRKDRGSYRFDTELTVQYVGHTESEKISLKGEVNFPQVQIDRDVFDIGVIGNGTEAVEEFSVTNPCNFCLSYKWFIKPRSTEIEYEPGEMDKLCFELECEDNIRVHTSVRKNRHRKRDKRTKQIIPKEVTKEGGSVPHKTTTSSNNAPDNHSQSLVYHNRNMKSSTGNGPKSTRSKSETHRRSIWNSKKAAKSSNKKDPSKELDHYGDWVQFVRNKFFRTRMMESIGLHDLSKEKEDESNYLTFNKVEPKTINNFAISQLIDIVPLAGIIQAGQTQNFVLVFYGHSNVKLKTTAICYIEGGTSKSILITAQSKHLEDIEVVESLEELQDPSPTVTAFEEHVKVVVPPPKKVSEIPSEDVDSLHEAVDKFKHRCSVRPTIVKKNVKIKTKK